MRKPMLAGNWKMNKTRDEAIQFMLAVQDNLPKTVESVVCAPAIILRDMVKRATTLHIGAQNMHECESGAFTGEISPVMLKDTGVEYVILGHSERRALFSETDEKVNAKIKKALEFGLKPMLCVGEYLSERDAGKTNEVLERQVSKAFDGVVIEKPSDIVVAYEPIWAIGTGKSADSYIAEEACAYIRGILAKIFSPRIAEEIRVLYGGSVTAMNIREYVAQPDVDGALVGTASLKEEAFLDMALALKQVVKRSD